MSLINTSIQDIQLKTNQFLSLINQFGKNTSLHFADTIEIELTYLKEILRFHEHRYYVLNEPIIVDGEYDALYNLLKTIETNNPSLITQDSPTQRVGSSLNNRFATVQHLVPMLSLENSYDANDLLDWDRKVRELSGIQNPEYCIEPKFDGASISLIYENDFLTRGTTRGDGIEGEDITNNVKQIKSIPLSAPFSKLGIQQIEIRGEVVITKQAFDAYNEQLSAQGLSILANPRNAASGSLRMKDPKEVAKRNLEAFLYQVSYFNLLPNANEYIPFKTHEASLKLLWDNGFRSSYKQQKIASNIQEVIKFVHQFDHLEF
jgi:DNA ligase (NAD+)